jgi:hypothetical protein
MISDACNGVVAKAIADHVGPAAAAWASKRSPIEASAIDLMVV